MQKRLIVNADDFGLTRGVSAGILEAHRNGILTSTTFMVNWPWAPELAPLLRQAPDLGVGLHLNLTAGPPVLPPARVPSLVGADGRFIKGIWQVRFRIRPAEAEAEWEAQLERFAALTGRLPTHLDTHHYVHMLPHLAGVLVTVAQRHAIPAARLVRVDGGQQRAVSAWLGRLRAVAVRPGLRQAARIMGRSGLKLPDAILIGELDVARLTGWIQSLPPGVTELVCHPGRVDPDLPRLSSFVHQREAELAALTDPAVRQALAAAQVQLIHFGHL